MITNVSGVAKTAYYCCGVRWRDAQARQPICGDHLAALFMDEAAQALFQRFGDMKLPNIVNATRSRIIDDWLRDLLLADPEQLVILLGAGLDTRAFRLPGGRWVEVDAAGLIAEKERLLPAARSPQPLSRLAVDFGRERLADALGDYEGEHAVVVMEGVSMYLTQAQMKATLSGLRFLFPGHTLITDLMTRDFATRHGGEMRRRLAEIGGSFAEDMSNEPARAMTAAGYRPLSRLSMMVRARELGAVPFPKLLLATVLKGVRDGYAVHAFEAGPVR
jgi:methyltransferase (TIGR00027 family)